MTSGWDREAVVLEKTRRSAARARQRAGLAGSVIVYAAWALLVSLLLWFTTMALHAAVDQGIAIARALASLQ